MEINLTEISGSGFAELLAAGAEQLRINRTIVNDLNVFPIPDGDTGDNMYMTIGSGARAVSAADTALGDAAAAAAHGMLLGARGNSGVILSRIFAGIAKGLEGTASADAARLAAAFEAGVTESYAAVAKPVEGTMLTVWREGVAEAAGVLGPGVTLAAYFRTLLSGLRASLDRTPDLLDTLRDAGVVDSGGAGIVCIFEGMLGALEGKAPAAGSAPETHDHQTDISAFTSDSVLEFGYCTEFLLRLQRSKVDPDTFDENILFSHLREVGESVAAFRDGTILKVHVHTMHPGEILTYCQQFGEFLTLKIENMMLQHEETLLRDPRPAAPAAPRKAYGIVAVACGKGMIETFESLGADAVINGGQSMNPSADDFIRAFSSVHADTILVFPNNGNVILTARQAAELYRDADVRVIPTRSIGDGYAAVSMLDTSSGDTDAILADAEAAIEGVVTGMVSRASRNTERDGVSVRKNDFIGFADDTVYTAAPDRNEAALALAEKLGADRRDVLLLLCGADPTAEEAGELYRRLSALCRRTEVIMIDGGQPIFDYILILE